MITSWHKTRALVGVYYNLMVEFRSEIILWMMTGLFPFVLMSIWMGLSRKAPIAGMGPGDFARYFLVIFIIRQYTVVWVIWEMEEQVVEGKLSSVLLQPMDPVWRFVSAHLAEKLTRTLPLIGLIIIFFALFPQSMWTPSPLRLLLGSLAIVLAFALRFLIQYTVAMLLFWVERASSIEQLWMVCYIFLSGSIAPLTLFPEPLRSIVMWTPFPYVIYFPATLITGGGSPTDILRGFAVMLLWVALFFVLNRFLWRRGLRQYSGMGA